MNEKLTPQQEMWHRMAEAMESGADKTRVIDVKHSNGRVLTYGVRGEHQWVIGDYNPVMGMFLRGEAGLAELVKSEPNESDCGNIDSVMRDVLSPLYRIYHEAMVGDGKATYRCSDKHDPEQRSAFKMIEFLIDKIGREKYMEMLAEESKED